jgi:hypothetical protein
MFKTEVDQVEVLMGKRIAEFGTFFKVMVYMAISYDKTSTLTWGIRIVTFAWTLITQLSSYKDRVCVGGINIVIYGLSFCNSRKWIQGIQDWHVSLVWMVGDMLLLTVVVEVFGSQIISLIGWGLVIFCSAGRLAQHYLRHVMSEVPKGTGSTVDKGDSGKETSQAPGDEKAKPIRVVETSKARGVISGQLAGEGRRKRPKKDEVPYVEYEAALKGWADAQKRLLVMKKETVSEVVKILQESPCAELKSGRSMVCLILSVSGITPARDAVFRRFIDEMETITPGLRQAIDEKLSEAVPGSRKWNFQKTLEGCATERKVNALALAAATNDIPTLRCTSRPSEVRLAGDELPAGLYAPFTGTCSLLDVAGAAGARGAFTLLLERGSTPTMLTMRMTLMGGNDKLMAAVVTGTRLEEKTTVKSAIIVAKYHRASTLLTLLNTGRWGTRDVPKFTDKMVKFHLAGASVSFGGLPPESFQSVFNVAALPRAMGERCCIVWRCAWKCRRWDSLRSERARVI